MNSLFMSILAVWIIIKSTVEVKTPEELNLLTDKNNRMCKSKISLRLVEMEDLIYMDLHFTLSP